MGIPTHSHLELADDVHLKLGTSADAYFYHNGSNTYLGENGTGALYIQGQYMYLQAADGDTYIDMSDGDNGRVRLFYDNSVKLSTTSAGISVTGDIVATGSIECPEYVNHTGDGNTNFGFGGADDFRVTVGGTKRLNVTTSGVEFAGNLSGATDIDITGSIKVTQNIRRTVTTASESSNTHTMDLTLNDNFNVTATNATNTLALTVASENVGQSGMIVITNPASVGSLAFAALPSYMFTPDGATLNWVTSANAIHIITYYVHATDKVLCNYVGNFS